MPSSSPVPFLTARSMLSSGMFSALAASMAVRSRAFPAGSPPPCLAAMVISRISLVKRAPRRASVTAFLRLICFHLLWPAMGSKLQLDPNAPPQLGYRAMKRPLSLALLIVLVCCAACERPGEGTSERELAAKVLTGVLAYPHYTLTGLSDG